MRVRALEFRPQVRVASTAWLSPSLRLRTNRLGMYLTASSGSLRLIVSSICCGRRAEGLLRKLVPLHDRRGAEAPLYGGGYLRLIRCRCRLNDAGLALGRRLGPRLLLGGFLGRCGDDDGGHRDLPRGRGRSLRHLRFLILRLFWRARGSLSTRLQRYEQKQRDRYRSPSHRLAKEFC